MEDMSVSKLMDFFITHLGSNLSHSKLIICNKHVSSEGCKF